MRCPRCGNDVRKDDFVCVYCSAVLKIEKLEKIKFFKRIDEKWVNPLSAFKRLRMVITNPARAFWDMIHYREKITWGLIPLFTAIMYGFIGLAVSSHIVVQTWFLTPITYLNAYILVFNGLAIFLTFFLYGFFYFLIFYMICSWLYSWGANYSINLSKEMKIRYSKGKKSNKKDEKKKTETQVEAEGGYVTALPDYITSQKSKKRNIMYYAFAPMIVGLGLCALVLWLGLPSINVDVDSGFSINPAEVEPIWNSFIWGIVDWIQVIVIIGWISITMAIALRDIANASTFRVYISCLIVSFIIALMFYFFRPSFLFQMNLV
jgi:hypothetical protein